MSPASRIYLDHNATTPIRPEVLEAMLPYLREHFGNPSSIHAYGQGVRKALEEARIRVASLMGTADPGNVLFTSCGTESNALAIQGAAFSAWERSQGKKKHLLLSSVEHDGVMEIGRALRRRGFEIGLIPVDGHGRVNPREVASSLRSETVLVSVMHANNEIGTLQPIRDIALLCREREVLFHSDAVQSAGKIPISVEEWGVDILSLSGHKLNAPKGVGALYVRKGLPLAAVVPGHQERNRRGGTENVASIVGLGRACELALKEMPGRDGRLKDLRRHLEEGLLSRIPRCRVNGHPTERLDNTVHLGIEDVEGQALVIALDLEGIAASSGAACSSGAVESSHVVSAIGLSPSFARGTLRLSLGWGNTKEEIDRALEVIPRCVERLRRLAPVHR